jgi:hypothetical protein
MYTHEKLRGECDDEIGIWGYFFEEKENKKNKKFKRKVHTLQKCASSGLIENSFS